MYPNEHLLVQSQQQKHQKKMYNMFRVNTRDTRTTSIISFWCPYCQLLAYFTPFSRVSIADFEHIFVCWDVCDLMNECIQGNRVLIFSQFVIMLDILEIYMKINNYSMVRFDGSTKGSEYNFFKRRTMIIWIFPPKMFSPNCF